MLRAGAASAADARSTRSRAGRVSATRNALRSWPNCRRGLRAKWRSSRMSRRLTVTLALGLAPSLVPLALSREQDAIAHLLRPDMSALALKGALAVCAGGLLLVMFREKLSEALEFALFWTVIGLWLVVGYRYRVEPE